MLLTQFDQHELLRARTERLKEQAHVIRHQATLQLPRPRSSISASALMIPSGRIAKQVCVESAKVRGIGSLYDSV